MAEEHIRKRKSKKQDELSQNTVQPQSKNGSYREMTDKKTMSSSGSYCLTKVLFVILLASVAFVGTLIILELDSWQVLNEPLPIKIESSENFNPNKITNEQTESKVRVENLPPKVESVKSEQLSKSQPEKRDLRDVSPASVMEQDLVKEQVGSDSLKVKTESASKVKELKVANEGKAPVHITVEKKIVTPQESSPQEAVTETASDSKQAAPTKVPDAKATIPISEQPAAPKPAENSVPHKHEFEKSVPSIEEKRDAAAGVDTANRRAAIALEEFYFRVHALAEEIAVIDPNNEMLLQLLPHLSTVLRDIDDGKTDGVLETLNHIEVILEDVKSRLEVGHSEIPSDSNQGIKGKSAGRPDIPEGTLPKDGSATDKKKEQPEIVSKIPQVLTPDSQESEADMKPVLKQTVEFVKKDEKGTPLKSEELKAETKQRSKQMPKEILKDHENVPLKNEKVNPETKQESKQANDGLAKDLKETKLKAEKFKPKKPPMKTEAIVELQKPKAPLEAPTVMPKEEPRREDPPKVQTGGKPEEPHKPKSKETREDRVPVIEVIPDPVYVHPLGEAKEPKIDENELLQTQEKSSISPDEVKVSKVGHEDRLKSSEQSEYMAPRDKNGKKIVTQAPVDQKKVDGDPPHPPVQEIQNAPKSDSVQEAPRSDIGQETSMSPQDIYLDDQLFDAEQLMKKNLTEALNYFSDIVNRHPSSARAIYGRAQCLDAIAELEKSNAKLELAINAYRSVMDLADLDASSVPEGLLREAGGKCVNKTMFRGFVNQGIRAQLRLIERFPDDLSLKNLLGVIYLHANQSTEARDLFWAILQRWPEDSFALAHYGFIMKVYFNHNLEGAEYMRRGLIKGDAMLDEGKFYFHWGDAYQREGHLEEAYKVYDTGVAKGYFMHRFQRALNSIKWLESRPVWTLEQTTYKEFFMNLEANWEVIRDEAQPLVSDKPDQGFRDEAENLRSKGDWKQFVMFEKGKKNIENCLKTPRTCELIQSFLPAATCPLGMSKFSVIYPGTHVYPHTGPTNIRLRAHLGLIVPKMNPPRIRIGNDTLTWQEGKVMVFDDSWEHEVWHEGDSLRVVLIIDFVHPQLTEADIRKLKHAPE